MKKLHKILTLALAFIMMLGVMAVPASAETETQIWVWTEDELRDLSIPRPPLPEKLHTLLYVIPRDKNSDELHDFIYESMDSYMKYVNGANSIIIDSHFTAYNFIDEVIAAAKEAYDRNTDPTWKNVIAETFSLDVGSTANEPEPPATEPETPVTPPVTTTPTVPETTGTVTGFSDVKPGDWYYEAVMALANSGILAGYADGTFRPNQTITMGELATIMCRMFGLDTNKADSPIARPQNHAGHDDTTVNSGHWAEGAMQHMQAWSAVGSWAMCQANMELNRGVAIGNLADYISTATWPDGTKLRRSTLAELKATLDTIPDIASDDAAWWKDRKEDASHYSDYRIRNSPSLPNVATGEEAISRDYICSVSQTNGAGTDLKGWSPYAIATAYQIGLVNGVDSTGRCDPWASVTRAQIVQMLYNMGITYAGQLKRQDISDSGNANFGFGGSNNSK